MEKVLTDVNNRMTNSIQKINQMLKQLMRNFKSVATELDSIERYVHSVMLVTTLPCSQTSNEPNRFAE